MSKQGLIPNEIRGGARISGKGVRLYKGMGEGGGGCRFADFISCFLNI